MYPLLSNGDEMYETNEYQKDKLGNEIYAKYNNGTEFYRVSNKKDIMAKRKNSNGILVPYFATHKDGYPVCPYSPDMTYLEIDLPYPKNSENKELYPRLFDDEFYIGINGNCKYARDEKNEEYYAMTMKVWEYYAFRHNETGDIIEYPRKNNIGEPIYIVDSDSCTYPRNLSNNDVLFPMDALGNQIYVEDNGKQLYAFSDENKAIYARNTQGDDILASNRGKPYYGFELRKHDKKHEIYPKFKNKNEFYLLYNKHKIYAKTFDNNEYYAQIWQGGDFLADKNGICYYATDTKRKEIYPLDQNGVQFYKQINNTEIVAQDNNTKKGFYAKGKSSNEVYPKTFIKEVSTKTGEEKKKAVYLTLKDIINHNASTT